MKCPKCGSGEILIHAVDTFQEDGLICIECGHVFAGKPDETVPRRLKVKGWRRAWWEAQK